MIIYTTVPPEIVFAERQETKPQSKYILFNGTALEVTSAAEGQYKVNRVISTCPEDYLDPQIKPGMVIEYINTDN